MTIPTSDLVARLRSMAEYRQTLDLGDRRDLRKAADEIERCHAYEREVSPTIVACNEKVEEFAEALRKAEARATKLRDALVRIAEFTPDMLPSLKLSSCIEAARRALEDGK